jgi:hypothetical protein
MHQTLLKLRISGRGSNESNFSNTPEEKSILLKKPPRSNEFQRLFELKKNEDQNNIKNGDYDPELKRYYCSSENNNRYILQAYANVPCQSIKRKASPEFTFENHKGGTTKLSDLKGQYVYIDIWATYALPTRNTSFAKNRKKYEGKKIAFKHICRY